ncbi:MAG: hypothetical protein HDQ88_05140 [Clostridia bacterium]|nr:hypothetical protein [Clostridia bacterium]
MKTNTMVYAILHGRIVHTLLVGMNKDIDIAYIKPERSTMRVTTDCVFETYQAAADCLATA